MSFSVNKKEWVCVNGYVVWDRMSCISRLNNILELRHPFSFGIIWCNLFGGLHGPAEWNRLHCSLSQLAVDAGYHVRCSQSIDRLHSMFNHFAHSRIPCVLVFTLSLLIWPECDLETWEEFWMCNVCSSWWHCAADRMLKANHLNWYKCIVLQSREIGGSGDSSVVRAPDSWSKLRGFESWHELRENFLLQGQLSVLTLVSVSVPPPSTHPTARVTTVARKCRCRVTAKHTCTLHMWLCVKWRDMVHGCMVYRECSKIAAVWRGINHVTTKQYCKHTTWVNIQNTLLKVIVTHL